MAANAMVSAEFRSSLAATPIPFPHFWEHTVGSDHAPMALREDWRRQVARCHQELGFRQVRFHGLLSDDVSTVVRDQNQNLDSFFNADSIFDFLLSIGMRPFVELSFMPLAFASGGKTVFHYKGNVTPPRDYREWGRFIGRLVAHLRERHGVSELRTWMFEVWNEPNLTSFWTGSQEDYFRLYRVTAEAIKTVDGAIPVGGPATAQNAWIEPFLSFCERKNVPADFVSTHHYPTDGFGQPGDDTVAQLAASRRSVLREQAQEARRRAGSKPLYYTEWNTSSNPRDPLHDGPYAAAFVVKTVMEAAGLVSGYSFWTFTDLFEENAFPSVPFHGGFGLLNIHGIPKPAYHAFALLHRLGNERLLVDGIHPTVDAWAVRGERSVTVLLTNHALPRHPIATERVSVVLTDATEPLSVSLRRVDEDHGNPAKLWRAIGTPEYLSPREAEHLEDRSRLRAEKQPFVYVEGTGTIRLGVALPPHAVAAVTIELDPHTPARIQTARGQGQRLGGAVANGGAHGANRAVLSGMTDAGNRRLLNLQRDTLGYFIHETNPGNGLVPDNTRYGASASIAAVGMALSAYPVGVERGTLSREEAAGRVLATLRFFRRSPQGRSPDATGYKGFYYHFLDMRTGRRAGRCELSTIDSAILLAGALAAAAYFDRADAREREIRETAEQLYRRADWQWATNGGKSVTHGWSPEDGFLHHRWEGYNEGLMIYVLGMGSPTHPLPVDSYGAWTATYDWKKLYGFEFLYAGPLFIHQLSHLWIDLRGIQDAYMQEKAIDYFENSRRATYVQQAYAIANPKGFGGYGRFIWGISASDGPGDLVRRVRGVRRRFYSYRARGVPWGPDDGTLSPWVAVASLPFAPEIVMPTIQNFEEKYPGMRTRYGFFCSLNPTFEAGSPAREGWIAKGYYGLDQGPVVLMIENALSGLLWRLMRQCPHVVRGLRRAGFAGGWLGSEP